MFNLIKLSFYRLFHQKSFFVMIAVTAALGFILIFSLNYAMNDPNDVSDETAAESSVNVEFDATMDEHGYEYYSKVITSFDLMTDELYGSGLLLIVISIFVSILTWAECKNGYIKNIAGQLKQRGMLPVSKLPAILFQTAVVLITAILSVCALILIFYKDINVNDLSNFMKNTAYQLLLIFAFGAFIPMVTMLFKNPAGAIITGILLSSGIPSMLCQLIDNLLMRHFNFPKDFSIAVYTIEKNITELMRSPTSSEVITRGIIVGIAYLAVSTVISYLLVQKRDV